MIKKLILLIFLVLSLTAQAQNADERISRFMNESSWFDLAHELKTTSIDSINPLLRQMAVAMTHHYFNRPDSACMVLGELLSNHQQELGANTLSMAMLMGTNLARTGHYAEAAELIKSLYDQLTAQGVDSTQTGTYRTLSQQYHAYAACGSICQPLHAAGEYRIPMVINDEMGQHSLNMNGSINGRESRLLFDTGAGVNIISSQQARSYGLHLLDAGTTMAGVGMQQGQYALADTLCIGGMAWANVPFLVVDIQTGHAKADSIGSLLPPVIGLPIMLRMQEVQLNFARREFIIPATPTPNPLHESNMLRTDSESLQLATTNEAGNPLCFHFDTGCYYTTLSPTWYHRHKVEVEATGTPDSLRMAGVGGVSITRSYILPQKVFRIGNGVAVLDSVNVNTGINLHTGQPKNIAHLSGEEDGVIGLNLLEKFSLVILNLKEMYLEAVPYTDNTQMSYAHKKSKLVE